MNFEFDNNNSINFNVSDDNLINYNLNNTQDTDIDLITTDSVDMTFQDRDNIDFEMSERSTGTTDYNKLVNKPKINDITLVGNKNSEDLHLQDEMDYLTNNDIERILNNFV